VGESIFLFAPSCVTVTTAASEESSSPTVVSRELSQEPEVAPAPAWGRETYGASVG
jgi:cell division inhibitor SepF